MTAAKRSPKSRIASFLGLFFPDYKAASVFEVSPKGLWRSGIRHVVLDLENTLVPYKARTLDSATLGWLDDLKRTGLEVSIVSNSPRAWVEGLLADHGIRYVAMARKPSRKAFLKVLELSGCGSEESIHIGDQLLTDIFGAHRVGMAAVLVEPLSKKGPISTHLQRKFLVPLIRLGCRLARLGDPLGVEGGGSEPKFQELPG
jgi:HAD superfamily phosphatase (TIGR01668 family)